MMTTDKQQLSRRDVADLAGIEVNTVDVYLRRAREQRAAGIYSDADLPEPDGRLGNRPWWFDESIHKWLAHRAPGGWHGQRRNLNSNTA